MNRQGAKKNAKIANGFSWFQNQNRIWRDEPPRRHERTPRSPTDFWGPESELGSGETNRHDATSERQDRQDFFGSRIRAESGGLNRHDAKRGRQDRQQIFLVPESEPDQKEFEPPRRQGLEVPESELVRDYLVTQETDTARFFLIEQSPEVQSLASKQLTARSPKKSGGARGVVAVDPDPTGG